LTFASACAVVVLPSIFPPYESFPAGVFASRRRNGCAKSFGGSHCCFCPD
jgi:hypothetical protein